MATAVAVNADAAQLFDRGLALYAQLRKDYEDAVGLKQYVEKLQDVIRASKMADQYLRAEEKNLNADLLAGETALNTAHTKAGNVVATVLAGGRTLIAVCATRDAGFTDDDLFTATRVAFVDLAEKAHKDLAEARLELGHAVTKLAHVDRSIDSVCRALDRATEAVDKELKAAEAEQRAKAYGGAAAGIAGGPAGLIISYTIAASVCEAKLIPELKKDFTDTRNQIQGYKGDFRGMSDQIRKCKAKAEATRADLQDLRMKLQTCESFAKIAGLAPAYCRALQPKLEELCAACERTLAL